MNQAAAPARHSNRLFFAVAPDAPARQSMAALLAQLRAMYGLQSRAVLDDRLHATLGVLGDYPGLPAGVLASAEAAARAATQNVGPICVSFDRAVTFISRPRSARRRPLVLTGGTALDGLRDLYSALSGALREAGLAGLPPSFTPHVTLMYDECLVPEHAVAPISWRVQELVLLHSRIGQNLPYTVMGRWPLLM